MNPFETSGGANAPATEMSPLRTVDSGLDLAFVLVSRLDEIVNLLCGTPAPTPQPTRTERTKSDGVVLHLASRAEALCEALGVAHRQLSRLQALVE